MEAVPGRHGGKLWIDRDGDGEFVRLHEDIDGNIEYPFWAANGSPSSPTTRASGPCTPPSPTDPA